MTVAFDQKSAATSLVNTASGTYTGTANTSITNGLTLGAFLVFIAVETNTVPITAVHLDAAGTNQALSVLGAINTPSGGLGRAEIWGLLNPTAVTNKAITLTSSAVSATVMFYGASFSGVQSFGTAVTAASASGTAGVTVASNASDIPVAIMIGVGGSGVTAIPTPTSNTIIFLDNQDMSTGSAYLSPGVASAAFTATGAGVPWVAVGVDLVAASLALVGAAKLVMM
jgi:hypothetical protein